MVFSTKAGPLRILGISGSLRRASYNTALLGAAAEHAPAGATVEIFDLKHIPLFDPDDEAAGGFPERVAELRHAIDSSDGLLIATPEYNYSITAALKNAIDWASRGGEESPLNRKPAAILGAGGRFGTLRSQMHLREILLHNAVQLVAAPQVMVDDPAGKFDDQLRLTDTRHRRQVARLLDALCDLIVTAERSGRFGRHATGTLVPDRSLLRAASWSLS
jgi:chromate reductase